MCDSELDTAIGTAKGDELDTALGTALGSVLYSTAHWTELDDDRPSTDAGRL
jgi:hypothetical protein